MPYILVIPGAGGGTTTTTTWPTLADFYVDLARQLGSYAKTTASTTIPGGEPGRWVLLDEFKDDEDERAKFAGAWIYVKSGDLAGTARRIRRQGFEGPFGALALSRVLPANLAADVFVEVTSPLPVRPVGATRGLVDLVNEGLARLWTEVRVQITGNGTSQYMDLPSWLVNEALVDGIYDWTLGIPTTEPPIRSSIAPMITVNGQTITLETGLSYSTAATFQLKAFVRANTLVFDGNAGTWGYVGVGVAGLVNDTDQAAVPLKWGTPVAMVKALQYLTRMIVEDQTLSDVVKQARLGEIQSRRLHWARAAANIIQNRLPKPTAPPSQGLTSIAIAMPDQPLVGSNGWPN